MNLEMGQVFDMYHVIYTHMIRRYVLLLFPFYRKLRHKAIKLFA